MGAITLAELPAIPGAAQVELAMALWQSLASSQLEPGWARASAASKRGRELGTMGA